MNNLVLVAEALCILLALSFVSKAMWGHARQHNDWFNPLRIFFKPVNDLSPNEYLLIRRSVYLLVLTVLLDLLRHWL
ncbi:MULTISPECIES: hypothetical protein [unclassified Agarivorans]|uniref:hypothetical protein n=1 Tax=unclassified Agarivorans TaxID=2636026 RepID=UPI0010F438AD|nr:MULTISPECIES: hypothetical protein [unclassified Agarivorans]MDO6686039.1 hypothetical protein [Agarivorans sp. 3_MG-2023]MDO6713823.1 hypothetical protein [Agarivorans sp. 2_MG-2023]